jgi:tRNA (mo5U34)-methyltransferase
MVKQSLADKRQRMESRRDWFHSIDVGDGLITPGRVPREYAQHLFAALQIPKSLAGMRVLDIGTYDGLYAFECERRGAREVVAVDVTPIDTHCFALASELLNSRVQYQQMSVYELDVDKLGGRFDLVLFPGVFYHLRHVLVSFDRIWNVLKPGGGVLVETHVCDRHLVLADGTVTTLAKIDPRLVDVPLFRFYRTNELNPDDWSNWFGPNAAAMLEVMRSAGFEKVEHLASWDSRASFRGIKNPAVPREWELGSYEGMSFSVGPDGTSTVIWHDPRSRPQ